VVELNVWLLLVAPASEGGVGILKPGVGWIAKDLEIVNHGSVLRREENAGVAEVGLGLQLWIRLQVADDPDLFRQPRPAVDRHDATVDIVDGFGVDLSVFIGQITPVINEVAIQQTCDH